MSVLKTNTIVVNTPATDGHPDLKMVAKRYTELNRKTEAHKEKTVSLLFMHGLGQHKEQWEPIIERLWSFTNSAYSIHEAWALDWQSHGDSAALNGLILGNADAKVVAVSVWGAGLAAFLNEGHLRGQQVIGIGFSIGNIALLNGLRHFSAISPPVIGLVIIEPILFDRETAGPDIPETVFVADLMIKSINSRSDSWPDRETARKYFGKRVPWAAWNPLILDVFIEHGLKALTQPDGTVVYATKCPKHQESSAFMNYADTWNALSQVEKIGHVVPIHVIFGSKERAMPRTWKACTIDEAKGRKIASIHRLEATHTVPQEKPFELAALLADLVESIILNNAASEKAAGRAQICKL